MFPIKEMPHGNVNDVFHHINIGDGKPFKLTPRRYDWTGRKLVMEEIHKMLDKKIVTESNSPSSSRILLIQKKDGGVRFCIDYRELNSI